MNGAITIVFSIFNKILDLLFNRLEVVSGVYLGWIIFVVIIFGIIFKSILNIPHLGIMRRGDSDEQ